MKFGPMHQFYTCLAVLLGMFVFVVPAQSRSRENRARGEIESLDTLAQTVTILPDTGTVSMTLHVGFATVIRRNGRRALFTSLRPGDLVEASYDPLSLKAGSIIARLNMLQLKGCLCALDAERRVLTVRNQADDQEVEIQVSEEAAIRSRGQNVTLAGLSVGDLLDVRYHPETRLALRLESRLNLVDLRAGLVAVDPRAGILVVKKSVQASEMAFCLDPACVIIRLGLPSSLAGLHAGDLLEMKYNPITMAAWRIEARQYIVEARGVAGRVDPKEGTFTIHRMQTGSLLTLLVDQSTVITRLGSPASLAELASGNQVEAHYNPINLLVYRIRFS